MIFAVEITNKFENISGIFQSLKHEFVWQMLVVVLQKRRIVMHQSLAGNSLYSFPWENPEENLARTQIPVSCKITFLHSCILACVACARIACARIACPLR